MVHKKSGVKQPRHADQQYDHDGQRDHNNRRRVISSTESEADSSPAASAGKKQRKNSSKTKVGNPYRLMAISMVVILLGILTYFWYTSVLRDIVRTPLQMPKMTEMTPLSAQHNPQSVERFWGSYRSGHYFGMKTRHPRSPVVGLMWMSQIPGPDGMPRIRHWCDQGDHLPGYGWIAHDGVNFGIQSITDHHYILTTDFVKRPGGNYGGEWSARFQVNPMPNGPRELALSLFVYMALDGEGQLSPELINDELVAISGRHSSLGEFRLSMPKFDSSIQLNYLVTYTPSLHLVKDFVERNMQLYTKQFKSTGSNVKYIGLVGKAMPEWNVEPNLIVFQVTTFKIPFEMAVAFESASFTGSREPLRGPVYERELMSQHEQFLNRFDSVFRLSERGYDTEHIRFAQSVFSNLLGGIGYFYGSSLVKSRFTQNPIEYWPAGLLTAVPSRSFFPRGFLWDEGFHQLLISRWDENISIDIIGHWLDLMNGEGWIPREQILGSEARARVPSEFIVQFNENANPPALFLPLRRIVRNLIAQNTASSRHLLRALYPRLRAWYGWFNRTQTGVVPTSYRWRGRNATTVLELNPKTLTSGLDDYPRASHPTEDERHVDLRCWMAFSSGVMADLTEALNDSAAHVYRFAHTKLNDNSLLDELHWSESAGRYSDYGLHTDGVRLDYPKMNLKPGQPPPPKRDKQRVVAKEPRLGFVDTVYGYVSLFPFLMRVLTPDSPRLTQTLTDLRKPELLWTPYGLRSLAKTAKLYGKHNTEHDPPYWRGAIWINVNYLTLAALHHYSDAAVGTLNGDLAKDIYRELRTNVVENIFAQFKSTGYVWEHYDDTTGAGKGSHPFTGWTALVVSIMAEDYV